MDLPLPRPTGPAPPLEPAQARAIKHRLMDRVADTDTSHVTIPAAQEGWQPFTHGVQIKTLHVQGDVMSYLLRLQAGATMPPHRHLADEECVVLDGILRVGTGVEIGPGGYHRAHRGALHATISTHTGATLFLRGAVPHASHVLA